MIRFSTFALLMIATAAPALAQLTRTPPRWRPTFSVSNGIATGNGGVLDNGTTFMQAMRASLGVVRGGRGIDVTAARLQAIIPQRGFTDMEYANPEGDAVVVSYVTAGGGSRKPPWLFSLGGGVIRRETAEAGRTRDTWVARAGYDAAPFWHRGDVSAGLNFSAYLSSSRDNAMVSVTSFGLYVRTGTGR